jgi:ribosome-binding protein aMBF1 (putative translation factor)
MAEHQDWNSVVFSKNNTNKTKYIQTQKASGNKKFHQLDSNDPQEYKNKDNLNFKQELQKMRLAAKMSQNDLAKLLNKQGSVINCYESGKIVPTKLEISNIKKILVKRINELSKV